MGVIPNEIKTAIESTIDKINGDDVTTGEPIRINYGGYVWKIYAQKRDDEEIQIIIRRMKR